MKDVPLWLMIVAGVAAYLAFLLLLGMCMSVGMGTDDEPPSGQT